MSKILRIFSILLILVLSRSAYGLFGFGIHGGIELMDEAKTEKEFTIIDGSDTSYGYKITRDAITDPIHVGLQFQFDVPVLPLGIELDGGVSWADYKVTAPAKFIGTDINIDIPGIIRIVKETTKMMHTSCMLMLM